MFIKTIGSTVAFGRSSNALLKNKFNQMPSDDLSRESLFTFCNNGLLMFHDFKEKLQNMADLSMISSIHHNNGGRTDVISTLASMTQIISNKYLPVINKYEQITQGMMKNAKNDEREILENYSSLIKKCRSEMEHPFSENFLSTLSKEERFALHLNENNDIPNPTKNSKQCPRCKTRLQLSSTKCLVCGQEM